MNDLGATDERALVALSRAFGSKLLTTRDACAQYLTDDSGIESPGVLAVVRAEEGEDIRLALALADEHRIPVTPRAGGSGRSGGAVPISGGLVLCTKQMNRRIDVDVQEGTAVVAPGVILEDLHHTVEREGWFYPPDPNSASMCCLGGNLAENAAGPRAFKYGATRDYVLGIETFVAGGTRLFSGRRTKKGVTGYDTTALLVGSEGTLAVFGDVTLRLLPKPERVMTLLALFPTMRDASRAVAAIIKARLVPRCIEFLDAKTLAVMRKAGNALDPNAGALLLIEVDGSETTCETDAEAIGNACDRAGASSVLVAQSDAQRAKLWESRKMMSHAVRTRARHKISEDVVVPRTQLEQLLDFVDSIEERHRIDALSYGHAGDGNLHVNFLWNDDEEKLRVDEATVALFRRVIELGGTLSGEHGIGLSKAPYLGLEQSPDLIALQKRLKAAFDPRGIMNPGKIFTGPGHGPC